MKPKICLGFGPTEGKCDKPAGCPHSPHWCVDCNKLRMEHITAQLEALLARAESREVTPP